MYRVAFDVTLPFVAASAFTAAGRSFAAKDPFDWRALGITEQVLFDLWQFGQVSHPLPSTVVMTKISEGESITVRTPQQRKQRRVTAE